MHAKMELGPYFILGFGDNNQHAMILTPALPLPRPLPFSSVYGTISLHELMVSMNTLASNLNLNVNPDP